MIRKESSSPLSVVGSPWVMLSNCCFGEIMASPRSIQQSSSNLSDGYDSTSRIDTFFQGIIFGAHGIPANDLVGPANKDRLLNAITKFYSQYMVQTISMNMRTPLEKNASMQSPDASRSIGNHDTNISYTGTLFYPGPLRMVQNKTSTGILQALIGSMVLCGTLAYIFGPKKGILTQKPPRSLA